MIPGPWKCPKRVGFLFPRPCERPTPIGCPDCNNGTIDDPYRRRTRSGYSDNDDFDGYDSSEIGGWDDSDSTAPAFAGGDSGGAGASMDFSEADGESLGGSDSKDFEDDLSAS
ncbi:MAG TPA: hypothetical protein VGL53_29715 [Bryobacteraceae bacterium]|jgi:hypothetical protein